MKKLMLICCAAALLLSMPTQALGDAWLFPAWTAPLEVRFQQVLRNEADVRFSSYYDGDAVEDVWQEMTLEELMEGEYGEGFVLARFAVVDLDMDLLPEIVLEIAETEYYDYPFEFIVLKAEDDAVYAHGMVYRALEDLKADGTFGYSSGAMDSGFGRAWFSGPRHGITPVSWSESGGNGTLVSFFVDGLPAAEDAFTRAARAQDAKAPALWLPLTDSVVDALPELPY